MIPSFIADMKHPEDFPKALYVSTALEIALFTLGGAIIYSQVGQEYITAPAYGSLLPHYAKTVAGFVLPTIISELPLLFVCTRNIAYTHLFTVIGCIYSLITARVIFFQIFPAKSIHRTQHTAKGWLTWVGITVALWVIAYVIGQAVPFFNDLLSLSESLNHLPNGSEDNSSPNVCSSLIVSSLFDSWFGFVGLPSYLLKKCDP